MTDTSTVETTDSNKDKDIIQAAKDCLDGHLDRESDNIRRAEDAISFQALEQWPAAIKAEREKNNLPCPVMDKTNQYIRQIVNEERMNRAAIKIRPVDDKADKRVAEVYTGIIRHIEDQSQAIEAYTTAGEHAISGGFGYFRILTEYSDPMSFDQNIVIKRIPNRFSVALGPHNEPDGCDCKEALIWEDMDLKQFEYMYPKAKTDGFDDGSTWIEEETIRVAEYMKIEYKKTRIHLMIDGSVMTDDDVKGLEEAIIDSRTADVPVVKWYKITGVEVLESKDMVGTYIPVIKVTGNETIMPDGKKRLSGAIEGMMDPQRLHNYSVGGFIQNVALAPSAPWLGYVGQFKTARNDFADANRKNITVLEADAIDINGITAPLPQRVPPPGIPPGWANLIQITEHGVQGAAGMYGPTVGAQSQEKSGVALEEQKQQGSIGSFHFPDNLARSIQQCGRILVQWIPHYYDVERTQRILGEDGIPDMAYLNPKQELAVMDRRDKFGKKLGHSFNLNVGKYDVTVSTGPSYTSKRQEAAQNQIALIQAKPELMPLIGDIVFSNQDAPGSDKIAERMKAMLPPQIQALEKKDDPEQESEIDQKMAAIQQTSQELEKKAHALFQKEQELTQAEAAIMEKAQETGQTGADVEAARASLEAEKRVFEADVKRVKAELALANLQREHDEMSEGEDDSAIKAYEAEMKYKSELAKAAASIIAAQVSATPAEDQDPVEQQPDKLEAVMQMLAAMVDQMSKPKTTRLITDDMGNPIGSETVTGLQ